MLELSTLDGRADASINLRPVLAHQCLFYPHIHYAKSLLLKSLTLDMCDSYLMSIKRGRHGVHMNINLSDQNCLTKYRSNASMGQTGPNGQTIHGQRDLLINEKNVFVNASTCTL